MMDDERLRRTQHILLDAQNICDKLDLVALEDGVIDEKEMQLLRTIQSNVNQYVVLLEKVAKDGNIDETAYQKMKEFEKNITSNIMDEAKRDGTSEGQEDILNVFFDCLKNLAELKEL